MRIRPAAAALRWSGVALILGGCGAVNLLTVGGAFAAARPASSSRLELRTGASYCSRAWDGPRGGFALSQYLLPVDVAWRTSTVRLSAGADFARADADLPGEPRSPMSVGQFRGATEFTFWRDRLRAAVGARFPTRGAGFSPGPARGAELLDEAALGLPRAADPGGPCWVVEAGGQPVRRAEYALQVGAAWERRGSYELLTDGRRLNPGDPWRLAASVIAGRGPWLGDFGLRWESTGHSKLDGRYSYREGDALTMRAGLRRQYERSRLDFTGTVSKRAGGSMEPGAPMDVSALDGGTAVRLGCSGSRPTRMGEIGLSLGLLGVRGYFGDLGSAWALEPGVSCSRGLADGRVGLAVRGILGKCRDNRSLSGLDVSLSWSGEWRP